MCPQPTSVGVRYGRPGFLAERLFLARWVHHFQGLLDPSASASVVVEWSTHGRTGLPRSARRHSWGRICLAPHAYGPTPPVQTWEAGRLARVPASLPRAGAGLSTCSPSPTLEHSGHQPRLRTRLTLGRLPWPRNPQACGVAGSHRHLRYSFRHSRFGSLHPCSRAGFSAIPERSPTASAAQLPQNGSPSQRLAASVACLSPGTLSARGHSTSELLRTLSRMAASKPTSWLSVHPHHLVH